MNKASYRTKFRELFARVKVFIDIVLGTPPKFLGDPIDIDKAIPFDSVKIHSDAFTSISE